MPIPDYQSAMLPFLRLASDKKEHRFRNAVEQLATQFQLTDEERAERLPSGTALLFDNRIGWARTYLKQAGLLESPRRGYFKITPPGTELLRENPANITIETLHRYDAFRAFLARRRDATTDSSREPTSAALPATTELTEQQTPEDTLAAAYLALRKNLALEVLEQVKACTPAFFEQLVIDLLVAMGYGGSRQDAGRAIGKSGDGGIDGIIKEDKLGLDAIYIQAKRWDGTVGRPEIQKFSGALQGYRASKGVFITTSSYSREAVEYASSINTKIILLDGAQVATLMIDHNVGVSTVGVYELKKLDTDYFEGD